MSGRYAKNAKKKKLKKDMRKIKFCQNCQKELPKRHSKYCNYVCNWLFDRNNAIIERECRELMTEYWRAKIMKLV